MRVYMLISYWPSSHRKSVCLCVFILLQGQHYKALMPEVFRQLQELDEKRIRNVRHFMAHSADVERNVFPIINKCLDGIIFAANQVNEKNVNV